MARTAFSASSAACGKREFPSASRIRANASAGIACSDVNGDNLPDILTANLVSDDVVLFENQGDAVFTMQAFPIGENPSSVACYDLQNDGDLDVVVPYRRGLKVLWNTCSPGVPGDLNCDDVFNGGDIDPFFLALGDPAAYAIAFPNCDPLLGDMNSDGRLDGGDIDPFFACLGGNCP